MRRRHPIATRLATALLALAAGPARADSAAGIAVRAAPPSLVLGTDERAALEIDAGGDLPPAVRASAGRVENVRALGGGRFAADYVPPAEAYPQVAIVSALAGERCGWTSIPLIGRGIAVARSVPLSPIRVTIGGASFGPVVADVRGEAHVPVTVPPGVRFAYHRGKPLDIQVPATPHVQLVAARTEAPADAGHDVPIYALVVTPEGVPRGGAPLEVSVTEGHVERLAEIAPGTFAGTWRLAPGRTGTASATARLAGDPAPARTLSVARPAGKAARISLESARKRLTAGDEEPLALRVHVADAAGNPVADVPRLESTLGTLSPVAPAGPGAWDATLSIPTVLGTARQVRVAARAAQVEAQLALDVAPGAPSRLKLSPDGATLVANGDREARLRVEVLDRFGNDVGGDAPEVQVTHGSRVRAERDVSGGWTVWYRPARARAAVAEVVSVRAGDLAGSARFELLAPERRIFVAPTLGFAASAGGLRAAYLGAQAGYWTSLFRGRLGLGADAATFVHERTDSAPVGDGALSVHGEARYVPVVAALRWRERLATDQLAWATVGAGLSFVSAAVSASGAPPQEQTGLAAALQASGAWGWRLGPGMPFAELRVGWTADPGFEALRGSLTTFTLSVGYLYDAY